MPTWLASPPIVDVWQHERAKGILGLICGQCPPLRRCNGRCGAAGCAGGSADRCTACRCEHRWFETGCAEDGCNALIISAESGHEHFSGVRRWVASAPVIDGRHGIVLKPARGFDFGLDYEDVTLGLEATWFVPLRSRHDPGMG